MSVSRLGATPATSATRFTCVKPVVDTAPEPEPDVDPLSDPDPPVTLLLPLDSAAQPATKRPEAASTELTARERKAMTLPPADQTATVACAGDGPRSNALRSQIGEADLEITRDENGALCGDVFEAVAWISVTARDEQDAAERVIALPALPGHPEPAQSQRLVEACEHHRTAVAERDVTEHR